MREFTVVEIIEFSDKIEQESYAFYTKASENVSDSETKELLEKLAEEEVSHSNRLRSMINLKAISDNELDVRVKLENSILDHIIKNVQITPDDKPIDILNIALSREKATVLMYATLITFTDLTNPIIKVFEELKAQEDGHVLKITSYINKLK